MKYKVQTVDVDAIIAFCATEQDAEEVGAALALAGHDVHVWDKDTIIHEFFTTE